MSNRYNIKTFSKSNHKNNLLSQNLPRDNRTQTMPSELKGSASEHLSNKMYVESLKNEEARINFKTLNNSGAGFDLK